MKVYIAGTLSTPEERERLERLAEVCAKEGFDTFLPHRDVGLFSEKRNSALIFEGDILKGLECCDLVVASLEGLHVGAGTAWELGYAYAKKIPMVGIKTDEPVEDAIEYLSSIIVASLPIVTSTKELQSFLSQFKKSH